MIDLGLVFELGKSMFLRSQYDIVLHSPKDFLCPEQKRWKGCLWADLTSLKAITSPVGSDSDSSRSPNDDTTAPLVSVEEMLRIIFTKFANNEFSEGLVVLNAEMGADWLSPVLQHPHCILRQSYSKCQLRLSSTKNQRCPNTAGNSSTSALLRRRSPNSSETLDIPIGGSGSLVTPSSTPPKNFVSQRPELQTDRSSLPSNGSDTRSRTKKRRLSDEDEKHNPFLAAPALEQIDEVPALLSAESSLLSMSSLDDNVRRSAQSNHKPRSFQPKIVLYLGPNVRDFCVTFYTVGLIPGVNSWSAVTIPEGAPLAPQMMPKGNPPLGVGMNLHPNSLGNGLEGLASGMNLQIPGMNSFPHLLPTLNSSLPTSFVDPTSLGVGHGTLFLQ